MSIHCRFEPSSSISVRETSQWIKRQRIGGGRFGTVHVASNSVTGALCAVKEMFDIEDPHCLKSIKQEIEVLSRLRHPNIVKYYNHEIVGNQIFLYMEYVQLGSLKKYIQARGALEEPLVGMFTAQILSGLAYLHSQRVVHRDIKAGNILVNSEDIVKLADFGLAKHLDSSVGNHSESGTPFWTAPEIIEKETYNSSVQAFAADIWSLGCTVIEMLTGQNPWHGREPMNVFYQVCANKRNPPIPETLSAEGKDFLKRCFTRNAAERPSAEALLQHSFVKKHLPERYKHNEKEIHNLSEILVSLVTTAGILWTVYALIIAFWMSILMKWGRSVDWASLDPTISYALWL